MLRVQNHGLQLQNQLRLNNGESELKPFQEVGTGILEACDLLTSHSSSCDQTPDKKQLMGGRAYFPSWFQRVQPTVAEGLVVGRTPQLFHLAGAGSRGENLVFNSFFFSLFYSVL